MGRPVLSNERDRPRDLAGWLIWERSRAAGAKRVVTFDARLLRSREFAAV